MKFLKIFSKRKVYEMNMTSANDTLQNVFAACEKEPNIIPFDKIILRQKADTNSACLCKYATILMILLLILIPLFTIHTKATINTEYSNSSIHIINHYVDSTTIHLTLEKDNYYYPSCYSIDARGLRHLAIVDSENPNHLIFTYTGVAIDIYISDMYGEYLHLIITPAE